MINCNLLTSLAVLAVCCLNASDAFVQHQSTSWKNVRQDSHHLNLLPSTQNSEIYVLSFDGVVADTKAWRSNVAIDVALQTWPDLNDIFMQSSSNEEENEDNREWLVNKMSALLDVTLVGEDGLVGVDAVLLARLLMEEQLLDEGRSNGSRGKYGSKFHPSSSEGRKGSTQGSRPLTVGEISANWSDGACIKDTVRVKYNVDRKDPFPIIRENIRSFLENNIEHEPSPKLHSSMGEALLDCNGKVYILVGDASHLAIAKNTLAPLKNKVVKCMQWEESDDDDENECMDGEVMLVPPAEGNRGHEGIVQHIIMSSNEESFIHVIHADITTLQKLKSLFGDNRPIAGMYESCAIKNASLKLSLPLQGTGPQQQNDAEMDPWLNIISDFDLAESMSAQIISS